MIHYKPEQFKTIFGNPNYLAVMSHKNCFLLTELGQIHDGKFKGFKVYLDPTIEDGMVYFMDIDRVRELNGLEGSDGQKTT